MLIKKLFLFLVCFLAAELGHGMDVTRDEKRNEYTLYLSGTITAGDLGKIVAAVAPPAVFPKYFTLESLGGDMVEAMAIGRFIRETASGTLVIKHCASACVLILIAGVSRIAFEGSSVGLHRPYYEPKEFAGLSLPDAEKKYMPLRQATRRYLEEMEMPTATIEKMFSISSDDIYYLTPFEKERILVAPSAYSEWIRAKCSPPTAQEQALFEARGFNIFAQFDKRPPTAPAFWAFISKMDRAQQCESALVRDVRKVALTKYAKR